MLRSASCFAEVLVVRFVRVQRAGYLGAAAQWTAPHRKHCGASEGRDHIRKRLCQRRDDGTVRPRRCLPPQPVKRVLPTCGSVAVSACTIRGGGDCGPRCGGGAMHVQLLRATFSTPTRARDVRE